MKEGLTKGLLKPGLNELM